MLEGGQARHEALSGAVQPQHFERAKQHVEVVETVFGQLSAEILDLLKSMLDFFYQPLFFIGRDLIGGDFLLLGGFYDFERTSGMIAFADVAAFDEIVDVQRHCRDGIILEAIHDFAVAGAIAMLGDKGFDKR